MTKNKARHRQFAQSRHDLNNQPQAVLDPADHYLEGNLEIRHALLEDLSAIVAYEIEIARISFPDDPMDDPETHENKLRKLWPKEAAGMFVLVKDAEIVGWLWISLNRNFLTGQEYATFRSVALSHVKLGEESGSLATRLFSFGIEYCQRRKIGEIVGKVHVNNLPMRVLYKQLGFQAEHLTMKKVLPK